MKKVIIIGGGAAGMFAAIHLKRQLQDQVDVLILELQNRIGKKLLVTGNGKCNISNLNILPSHYNDPIVRYALEAFPPQRFIKEVGDLGLILRSDEAGRLYPYSEKASNVLDIFRKHLDQLGVGVTCDICVNHIKSGEQFLVYSKDYRLFRADFVLVATGGASGVSFAANGYDLLTFFGHELKPLRAGLVAVKTKENVKSLAGLRVKATVRVFEKNNCTFETTGEVLFKDNGLSGIAIFEASRYVGDFSEISLDLVPEMSLEEVEDYLRHFSGEEGLLGLFPKMIGLDLIRRGGSLAHTIKDYRFTGITLLDFPSSQVTRGGILMKGFDPLTFESSYVKGLYAAGEVLDIDGASGGFNLHFAWASSMLAAEDMIRKIKKEEK